MQPHRIEAGLDDDWDSAGHPEESGRELLVPVRNTHMRTDLRYQILLERNGCVHLTLPGVVVIRQHDRMPH